MISRWITRPLGYFAGAVTIGLLVLTVVDVALRATRGRGVLGAIEYIEVGLAVAVFAALPYAEYRRDHIATSFVTSKMPRKTANMTIRVVGAAGLVVLVLMAWASIDQLLVSLETGESTIGISQVAVWPGRLAVVVAVVVYAYEFVRRLRQGADQPVEIDD